MLETGDWFVPQLDYEPHWSKPPLTYWALAGGMLVLGENEWGVRAASAVSYIVIVAAVYALGSAMWGRRTAFAAGLIYATSPLAVIAANGVSTDTLLAMWEALAALAYWRAVVACANGLHSDGAESGRKLPVASPAGVPPARRRFRWSSAGGARAGALEPGVWIVLFWLFAGLGFLTKGPPALLTPLVVFIYHGWRRGMRKPTPALTSPWGMALFAVVGFGWFVAVGLHYEGLLGRLVREEVVGRVADPAFNRNPDWYGPLVIIILPFILGLGPWLFYWRRAWRVLLAWGLRRDRLRAIGEREALLFCVIWAIVPLAVLCLSTSRLPLYVLPFVPALALLTGRAAVSRIGAEGGWTGFLRIGVVAAFIMLVVKGVAPHVDSRSDVRPVYEHLQHQASASGDEAAAPMHAYAYELTQDYGLEFYLRGRMTRVLGDAGGTPNAGSDERAANGPDPVTPDPTVPDQLTQAPITPGHLLELLADNSRVETEYIVARSRTEELSVLLEVSGLQFTRDKAGSYYVFGVAPPATGRAPGNPLPEAST
jgi:4-amino-4-deoxy-L-arabinose transferase